MNTKQTAARARKGLRKLMVNNIKARAAVKTENKEVIMQRYTWLIEAGHGGMINGEYQTSTTWWKRSYFKDGILLDPKKHSLEWLEANCDHKYYEGVGNRDIARRIMKGLDKLNIKYSDILNGSEKDISLQQRVDTANAFYAKDKNCIFLSIHSNAFTQQSAGGFSVYTSVGPTNSDKVATILWNKLKAKLSQFPERKDIRDGDPDYEENFYVLRNTAMPAVCSESLFYTNWEECKFLSSEEGRQMIADAHIEAIQEIEKNGL